MKKIILIFILLLCGCSALSSENICGIVTNYQDKENQLTDQLPFNELFPVDYDECYILKEPIENIKDILPVENIQYCATEGTHLFFIKDGEIVEEGLFSVDSVIDFNGIETISFDNELVFSKTEDTYVLKEKEIAYEDLPLADLSHSLFLGNSKIEALFYSGLIEEADFITKIGWNVADAIDEESEDYLFTQLEKTDYDRIFLLFGDNELGWYYPDIFIADYKTLITKLEETIPEARIFVISVFPVSQEVNDTSKKGVTNENVVKYNEMIQSLCEEMNVKYLDVHSILVDDTGALPEESSSDGMHPYKEVLAEVVQYLKENSK